MGHNLGLEEEQIVKILILSQYFPPETGAPQNRLHSLALNLAENGITVNILTAMPNYPKMEVFQDYKGRFFVQETAGPLTIFRSWIFVKKYQQNNSPPAELLFVCFQLSYNRTGKIKKTRYYYL